ncbi:hypothetical protein niasHS_010653 [Heterodera schachtii]|uniref:NADH:ubiquinone oxidoreductase intermediate-associated protein 30 domain-containing protein n=1 Tax=Heterodera schachtii TaxID=97005 RepID=A0ABD2IU52_HETSC
MIPEGSIEAKAANFSLLLALKESSSRRRIQRIRNWWPTQRMDYHRMHQRTDGPLGDAEVKTGGGQQRSDDDADSFPPLAQLIPLKVPLDDVFILERKHPSPLPLFGYGSGAMNGSPSSSKILHLFLSTSFVKCQQTQAEEAKSEEEFEEKETNKRQRKGSILKEKPNYLKPVESAWHRFLRSLGMSSIRQRPRSSAGFADKRSGFDNWDLDVPMEILLKEAPKWYRKQPKLLASEMWQRIKDRVLIYDRMGRGTVHGETSIKYEFKTDEDFGKWLTGSDSEWSEGFSKCKLYRSDRGSAIFEGTLSTRLVKDGKTQRAGWCSMRSLNDKKAFDRKNFFSDWSHYTHLLIKCRGDGRTYKVMLHIPQFMDITWGNSYTYLLHTHGGPHWQFEMIPFSRFVFTVEGRAIDVQYPLDPRAASSIGITLMDRIEGPFRLEIDFIGATHDISHLEKHAYEKYNIPLGNPML